MTTVAFIGLGIMGGPMAANLVKAGFDVVGLNRSPEAVQRLVSAGGRSSSSIREAVTEADVIATMLPDTPDVEAVLAGDDGVFAHARPGSLVIDFSTIEPSTSAELATMGASHGLRVLDAPVSGGEQGAIDGSLSIMVGGTEEDCADACRVLSAVGQTIVRVGVAGSGQTVKAANQLIVAGTLQLVAEALVFLEAHDVDTSAAVQVLSGGLAGSTVLSRKSAAMLSRDFAPGFRVELHHKDLSIVTAAARSKKVAVPLAALTAQLIGALDAQGAGGLDHSALFAQVERLSGRSLGSAF